MSLFFRDLKILQDFKDKDFSTKRIYFNLKQKESKLSISISLSKQKKRNEINKTDL